MRPTRCISWQTPSFRAIYCIVMALVHSPLPAQHLCAACESYSSLVKCTTFSAVLVAPINKVEVVTGDAQNNPVLFRDFISKMPGVRDQGLTRERPRSPRIYALALLVRILCVCIVRIPQRFPPVLAIPTCRSPPPKTRNRHPATTWNQKKIWEAEQKDAKRKKDEAAANKELKRDNDRRFYEHLARGKEQDPSSTALNFMYAPPPGFQQVTAAAAV